MTKRLDGRLAVITGASQGIGRAVAQKFAEEGAELILVARSVEGLEGTDNLVRAAGGEATLVPLDLVDGAGIDRLGAAIADRWGRLDILVGNAAMLGTLSPVGHIDPAEWTQVMRVNVTANWWLLRSLDSLLRASESGRAIFVTSGVTQGAFAYYGPYAASKAALESLVRTYAAEITKSNVRANLIDPGVIRTAMRARAYPGEDPETLRPPEAVTEAFVALAEEACPHNGARIEARD
ncbi:MAG: SDR family NAD(P)-dependent oxidoreductase [Alphaproteobacteria bacterium]|jgi:NAD(P)-dependent dehydrogenase (short-subunit alcohol dehydrogenase family)|nr:SDR family NAD(P)-dependent oxidoreductase [Alphaproteobacteria bacterium]MBT4710202.1 SDR family NAD(P)-dependent oxidoreductase [Alphaproteobacteria bacterium]MBT5859570.1 SDR family NAD(P)-dependent oxidoreductase [Alphaproteobacteria bacterium]